MTSERVEQLDPPAEVFYRRLMSKVDDHGLYDARPSILRASLFPLRLDRVREADCSRWIAACEKAGLIVLYEADGRQYLCLLNTGWDKRSKPKYPLPPENNCKQSQAIPNTSTVVEGVVEVEGNPLSGKPDVAPPEGKNGRAYVQEARDILDYLNRNAGREFRAVDSTLNPIVARLKSGASALQCREVVFAKCEEWKGDAKMAKYLRPETLFNATKFESYLGELRG